ncbi:MAG TPA: AraD1 family protein [Candidatus Sulfopaludibacter sp.]|nr:AraD1 family protein [Candidatus Sulfopaludibacter sp.]
MRLIQLQGPGGRATAVVEGERLQLLHGCRSIYELAQAALASAISLRETAALRQGGDLLDYGAIWRGDSDWRILPAIDHPVEPARCLVSGTGLSHIRSAGNRDAMHAAGEQVTDSMRMYQWGAEGGKPEPGRPGVAPEWFFKGTGGILRAHNEPLDVPAYAEDGGEEPEIAGVYIVDAAGAPRRIGMCAGNEFSDHIFEKKNYLYLAASKLRTCAIGPELVVDPNFSHVPGKVTIERGGAVIWAREIATGEAVMCHSLANLEHHHFKFEAHRRPGDVHVHFFGADAFSFGEGLRLVEGDVMQVRFEGFGRPLRNPLRTAAGVQALVEVTPV